METEQSAGTGDERWMKETKPQYIDIDQLRKICKDAGKGVDVFIPYLNDTCREYSINTTHRISMFVANLAHETGQFHYLREIYGPTKQQKRYERDFKAPWAKHDPINGLAFDLGNTQAGDGKLYLGRGCIQTTGRANYTTLSKALGVDFVTNPQLLETPSFAIRSAGYFWHSHNLNKYADAGDVKGGRKVINGGLNGVDEVQKFYEKALEVL